MRRRGQERQRKHAVPLLFASGPPCDPHSCPVAWLHASGGPLNERRATSPLARRGAAQRPEYRGVKLQGVIKETGCVDAANHGRKKGHVKKKEKGSYPEPVRRQQIAGKSEMTEARDSITQAPNALMIFAFGLPVGAFYF